MVVSLYVHYLIFLFQNVQHLVRRRIGHSYNVLTMHDTDSGRLCPSLTFSYSTLVRVDHPRDGSHLSHNSASSQDLLRENLQMKSLGVAAAAAAVGDGGTNRCRYAWGGLEVGSRRVYVPHSHCLMSETRMATLWGTYSSCFCFHPPS